MKVMIVIGNRSVGGAQRVAMHLYNWLNNLENCSAQIVSLTSYVGKKYDMSNYNFIELKKGKIIPQLRKLIKDKKPDIVLSMGVPMVIYTVPACLATRTKHIISERNDPAHFAGKAIIKYLSRFLMKLGDGFVFQTKDAQNFYHMKDDKRSVVIPNPISNVENMPEKPYEGIRNKTIVSVGRLNKQKNQKMLIEAFAELSVKYPNIA